MIVVQSSAMRMEVFHGFRSPMEPALPPDISKRVWRI